MPALHLLHAVLHRPAHGCHIVAMIQSGFDQRSPNVSRGAEDEPGLLDGWVGLAGRDGGGGEVEFGIVGEERVRGEDSWGCHEGRLEVCQRYELASMGMSGWGVKTGDVHEMEVVDAGDYYSANIYSINQLH
jgi:hypothetical protein